MVAAVTENQQGRRDRYAGAVATDPVIRVFASAMISPRRRDMSGCRATPAFATDRARGAYYEQRGGEYEEWYTGEGLLPLRGRSG